MIKALAVGRVSSKEQAENNHSLQAQRGSIDRMIDEMGLDIVQRWEMAISSKKGNNLKRKDLTEAMDMCKRDRDIKYILFDRVNRLGREAEYLTYYKLSLKFKYGVELIFCDSNQRKLNNTSVDAFADFVKQIVQAEEENTEKAQLIKSRMQDRVRAGYYPLPIRLGYKKTTTPGLHSPTEPSFSLIREAMKKIISGTQTAKEALTWATHNGLVTINGNQLDMYRWIKLLKEPFYMGVIQVSDWEPSKGLHTPMLTKSEFEKLQSRIQNVKPKYQRSTHFNPDLPLQKVLSCGICKGVKRISGSISSNGHGGKFPRYFCMDCRRYQRRDTVHAGLEKLLETVRLSSDTKKRLTEALKAVWSEKEHDIQGEITLLKKQEDALLATKSRLVNAFAEAGGELKEDIQSEILQVRNRLNEVRQTKLQLLNGNSEVEEFIAFALDYASNLVKKWWTLEKEDMLWCQKIVFPGDIFLKEDGIFGTNEISPIFRLARYKKGLIQGQFTNMVEMAGIAPASKR